MEFKYEINFKDFSKELVLSKIAENWDENPIDKLWYDDTMNSYLFVIDNSSSEVSSNWFSSEDEFKMAFIKELADYKAEFVFIWGAVKFSFKYNNFINWKERDLVLFDDVDDLHFWFLSLESFHLVLNKPRKNLSVKVKCDDFFIKLEGDAKVPEVQVESLYSINPSFDWGYLAWNTDFDFHKFTWKARVTWIKWGADVSFWSFTAYNENSTLELINKEEIWSIEINSIEVNTINIISDSNFLSIDDVFCDTFNLGSKDFKTHHNENIFDLWFIWELNVINCEINMPKPDSEACWVEKLNVINTLT